jgi:hypothetical protein
MKHLFSLFLITTLFFSACKKDNDPVADRNCGTLLYIDKQSKLNDGGITEWQQASGCGATVDYMEAEANRINGSAGDSKCIIFYKGMTRTKVKYIVAKSSSNLTLYIRYESNTIPDASIKHWQDEGYKVEVKELTGLEGANY